MRYVPPTVTYLPAGGPAYLLAWERHADRTWWAEVIWVEVTDGTYHGRHARVVADDLAPIPGQDYTSVPRRGVGPRGLPPSDPTDPRDPVNRNERHSRYQRSFERMRRRPPEPDF